MAVEEHAHNALTPLTSYIDMGTGTQRTCTRGACAVDPEVAAWPLREVVPGKEG